MPEDNTPKIGRVLEKGDVSFKKKTTARKLLDNFVSTDMNTIGNNILDQIVIPTIIDLIVDTITSGVNMIFKRDARRGRVVTGKNGQTRVLYDEISTGGGTSVRSKSKSAYDIMDITIYDRGKAALAEDHILEWIKNYPVLSVYDVYDALGYSDTTAVDHDYGWFSKDMANFKAIRVSNGWTFQFPYEPRPIK